MIYLIGGCPRGGKSILSRRLSKKLNIPYISTDNIRPILMPFFNKKEQKKKFRFADSFSPPNVDTFFRNYSRKKIFNDDIREAKTIWPGVESLIKYLIDCEMNYIIEGFHLLPDLLKQFNKNKNVKIIFLIKQDSDKIFEGLLKSKNNNDWISSHTKDKDTLILAAKSLEVYGDYFIKEIKKYGFKYINTENNFIDKISQALKHLMI